VDEARVFIIGRKTMCVEGLAAILGAAEGITVAGRAYEWSEGLSRVGAIAPDVVIVDMAHCPECGPTTPLAVVESLEGRNVVILASRNGTTSIVDALEAGALGYLELDATRTDAIRSTVLSAARGEATLDSALSTAVLGRMRSLSRRVSSGGMRDMPPTEREAEVLTLLVKGCSNREIANQLHVSESTVKNHLHSIYSKLGAESRSQAVSEAIRRGIVTP